MTETSTGSKKFLVIFFLAVLFSPVLFVSPAKTETIRQRVAIQADGTVSPSSAPIKRDGNTYTLTGNIFAEISVQKSDIAIDGAGYTIQGTYNGTNEYAWMIGQGPDQVSNDTKVPYSIGVDLAFPEVTGLTIKNLNIKNFSIGIYIWTSNNTVTRNAITENIVGVLLSGANNSITGNYVARNQQGLFFGWNEPGEIPSTIDIDHNSFNSNEQHLSGCLCEDYNLTEIPHTWDDGKEGNYWDDYYGSDTNGDGIGGMPYIIDALNRDRYPLMENPVTLPTPSQDATAWAVITVAFIVILATTVIAPRRRKDLRPNQAKPSELKL